MAIELDELAMQAVVETVALSEHHLDEPYDAVEAYLKHVWRPVDAGAKTGEPVLIRRHSKVVAAIWDDGMWELNIPMINMVAPEDWPTHYAPLAAFVDLEG